MRSVTAAVMFSILGLKIFPACFVDGVGLTAFKIMFATGSIMVLYQGAVLLSIFPETSYSTSCEVAPSPIR